MSELSSNYFALFGLSPMYQIDVSALQHAFHRLQAHVHPDRSVNLSETEKLRVLQWSTQINEAFVTLREPLKRAVYLLTLNGVEVNLETNTAMSTDFLMQQMGWREALDEARDSVSLTDMQALQDQVQQCQQALEQQLAAAFETPADLNCASETVRKLMFIEKFQQELVDAQEALES